MFVRSLLLLLTIFCCLPGRSYSQTALLEDFSSVRKNSSGSDLWSTYIVDCSQPGSIQNGMWVSPTAASSSCAAGGYSVYAQFFPYPYSGPSGFAHNWLRSGTWDPNANRLRMNVKCGASYPRDSGNSDTMGIGTYVKQPGNTEQSYQGMHYYHSADPNIYANRWMRVTFNRHPQHMVGDPGSKDYPEDPEWVSPTTGAAVHYMDGLTRFYFVIWGGAYATTCSLDDVYFETVTGEPDTLVSSVTATHTGPISGYSLGRYEVSWAGPKNVDQAYNIRYSTSSMKVSGFGSGTDGGRVSNPGSAYTSTIWYGPNMSEQKSFYVAIQPEGQSAFTEVYIPAMNSTSTAASPCDLNSDGTVDPTDVTMARDGALNASACQKDLDGNGRCDVVDLQRVVNASLGGTCRVGQ